MSAQSLAQYVASMGGIRITDPALQGELDRLRPLARSLWGRNAVLTRKGRAYDVVAIECREAGYPVDEDNFLEMLELDAYSWVDGSERDRVWVDYEVSADAWAMLDAEFEDFLMEQHRASACGVCGFELAGDVETCETCRQWARKVTDPLGYERDDCADLAPRRVARVGPVGARGSHRETS